MFSSITSLLLFFTVILQVSNQTDAARNHIDRIVKRCETKEEKFADTEDKYAKKGPPKPDEPQLFPTPTSSFIVDQTTLYQSEVMQRKFECIANRTKKSDEKLRSSPGYLSLVEECKANQSTKAMNYLPPKCNVTHPYKTNCGKCNNIVHQYRGTTFSHFRRLFLANYEGVSGFRKSVNGKKPLPNARYISRKLIKPSNSTTRKYNALFAFFGQVVAYDIALFPVTFVYGSQSLDCCKNATNGGFQHPQCAPILIDPTDEFYSKKNITCFNFVRAIPYDTCSVGKRNLINYVTTWIDLSQVYGSTYQRAMDLSTLDSGKLKSEHVKGGELLPPEKESGSSCGDPEKGEHCFKSGDIAMNIGTIKMILHTLLVREHNRIADRLKVLNPIWDDWKLYEESRRILIAEFQMIIYNEYLPVLLGKNIMSKYRLNINSGGVYDFEIDPSISVIFSAAAHRIHSILPGKVVYGEQADQLRDLYSNAIPIYKERISAFLQKMADTKAEKYDRYMPEDLTQLFHKPLNGTWGFDINAVNIQRGRDVGLPTYTQVIEYKEKRNGTIKTFDDLKSYIEPDCLDILKNLYADVRDIDFYVGIICEKYPDDMIISETAAEIIAEQFERLKYGDRFYFENDLYFTLAGTHTEPPHLMQHVDVVPAFRLLVQQNKQKQTLLNASLAKLICDNTEVQKFQKLAFMLPSNKNKKKNCSDIPGVDLTKWKENIVQKAVDIVDKYIS